MPTKIGIRLLTNANLYANPAHPDLERSTILSSTLKEFVSDSRLGPLLAETSIPGSKIIGGLAGSKLTDQSVTGEAVNTGNNPVVLGKIALATITGANIANNSVDLDKVKNVSALSVLGRNINSNGPLVEVTSAISGDVLRRSGDTIGFGSLDTSSFGSGTLPVTRGGTGNNSTPLYGQLLIGNSSSGYTLGTIKGGENVTVTNNTEGIKIDASLPFPVPIKGVNGSQTLPSGIIIKWGELSLINFGEGPRPITFTTEFPNACYQVTTSLDITGYEAPSSGANASTQVHDINKTGFNCYLQAQNTITGNAGLNCKIRFIAIGN